MKTKKIFITAAPAVVSMVLILLLFVSCVHNNKEKQLWTCPMHPYYISDKPGDCPICGMKLVKVDKTRGSNTGFKQDGNTISTAANMPGMDMSKIDPAADRATVRIDPEKQQLINIRTDVVKKRALGNEVSAAGVVAYDPELYYTQQQYISASLNLSKAKAARGENGLAPAKDALDTAATRLRVMGLSDQQIKDLDGKAEPDRSLLISGQGGKVWVYAQVNQDDMKYVRRKAEAEVSLSSEPDKIFTGSVMSVDPALDPGTRSTRVRVLVKGASGEFKPEMYVNVMIKSPIGNFLSVPEDAIMDTGTKKIAFVDKGNGYFEPRYVTTGAKIGGYYIVRFGLSEGEKVVTNANFLIDSESQLKAALGQMR
jgi:Cu(I)/Ag(I) efflux system membrane fusion protein